MRPWRSPPHKADSARQSRPYLAIYCRYPHEEVFGEVLGFKPSELGKRLKRPPYGITRYIDSLQEAGFVERRENPTSRRNHLIFLMAPGRALAPKVLAVINRVNDNLMAGLPAAERQAFSATLAKLV